ncbi:hypothetical protein [Streptomyces sp. NPDC101455]|uniref:hypothetical protein n=1 Tax=Streptomyces sp. NPDC101455 TaxID=3366142 RepID=UPI00382E49E2
MASSQAEFRHYQRIATAAWATGRGTLVLNHGTPPHPWHGTNGTHLGHLVHGVPPDADTHAHADFEAEARARGTSVHCVVPGMGDHPWGTLPHTLEPVP